MFHITNVVEYLKVAYFQNVKIFYLGSAEKVRNELNSRHS